MEMAQNWLVVIRWAITSWTDQPSHRLGVAHWSSSSNARTLAQPRSLPEQRRGRVADQALDPNHGIGAVARLSRINGTVVPGPSRDDRRTGAVPRI